MLYSNRGYRIKKLIVYIISKSNSNRYETRESKNLWYFFQ